MPIQIKICGTTSPSDARLACEAGADLLGVVLLHPPSPRCVSFEIARQIRDAVSTRFVALSVNQNFETLLSMAELLDPFALQLHGDETPELVEHLSKRGFRVWKAISGDQTALFSQARDFQNAGAEVILVDAREISPSGIVYGGTGQIADWNTARALVLAGFRVVLAGGLSSENVKLAIETVRPWGVDVVSGVEAQKGVKDARQVHDFIAAARSVPTTLF